MFAIINTAWIRYLCELSDGPSGKLTPESVAEHADKLDTLWRLVLKAIEFTELRRFWASKGSA
jgi:hypothetical protein